MSLGSTHSRLLCLAPVGLLEEVCVLEAAAAGNQAACSPVPKEGEAVQLQSLLCRHYWRKDATGSSPCHNSKL